MFRWVCMTTNFTKGFQGLETLHQFTIVIGKISIYILIADGGAFPTVPAHLQL